ncbi:heavy-metal-associated domain-containing protein [Massilibacteroides sp.]|uniref:heavy-metal-associated domain-containing protein n=1 Tax=Massilibacteroides sp. TaxID=2034766 RepID=UPI002606A28A|nr:heavy-metal-associated domain-containing protein [Massilibacteroides sp.]MDD4515105.1 heavy-metal-associated domain-containing protein [Massilibacteroides sp.]
MKRLVVAFICVMCACSIAFAQDKPKKKKETVTFYVEEMECKNCVKKVEKNIAFEKGVADLRCDLSNRTAKVTYNTSKTSPEKIAAAFKKIGMEAVVADGNEESKDKK